MDVRRLDAQEQRGGDGRGAEGQTHEALVAGARAKERRADQRGKRGKKPDPIAELTQEYVRRLAIAGVGLGVVMRAEIRRPIDQHRAQEREQGEGAERSRCDGVAPAKARASPQRGQSDFERQHDDDSRRGEGIPAPEREHRVQGQRERDGDAPRHGSNARAALPQGDEASEAFGQLERAHHQHETADIGHAACRDRERRRVSDKHDGDAESQLCVMHRQADPQPRPEEPAQQASRRLVPAFIRTDASFEAASRRLRTSLADSARLRLDATSSPRAIARQHRQRQSGRRGIEGEDRETIDGARRRLSQRQEKTRNQSRRPGIVLCDRLNGGGEQQRPVSRVDQARDHHRDAAIGHEVGDHQIARDKHEIGGVGGEARERSGEQRR